MTEKKDDIGTWAVLGALGAAIVAAIASSLGNGNKGVNSYQPSGSGSYSPPSQPSGGGCGCSAGR